VYEKFNSRPTSRSFDHLNASIEIQTQMVIVNLQVGIYEIGLFGYEGGAYTLQVNVVTVPLCDTCSAHGACQAGICHCYSADFIGNYCETYTPNMELGRVYDGQAITGFWNYWNVHYFTQSSLRINVTQTSGGDCDLYIRPNQNPTRFLYQLADLSVTSSFSLTIQAPGDDVWHLGVYGWNTCAYTIVVNVLDECQCASTSVGHCEDAGAGQCICNLGHAGPDCSQVSYPILSGQVLYHQSAPPHSWNFYYYISSSRAVSVTMTEQSSVGFLTLFVSMSGYPTGENYDYVDYANSSFHEIHITWYNAPGSLMYFIGVVPSSLSVANNPLEFSITVYGTPF